MSKLLIIGLDGADWEYVSRRMEAGGLPALRALAEEGAFGPLESTRPPLSCPAWPAMTTGLNPGNLGLFDLTAPVGYGKRIVSARDICAARLWDYVGACGGRSVVLNVPVTYPPRQVSGVLVAGLLSPEGGSYAWPAELGEELSARFGYSPKAEHSKRRQIGVLRRRRDVLLHLLAREAWDMAMAVFSVTDWAQHDHWADRAYIDRLFDEADAAIGEVIRSARPENVAVISDHGFTGTRRILNLNRLLCRLGFLTYGTGKDQGLYAPNPALTRRADESGGADESGRARGRGLTERLLGRVIRPRKVLRLLSRCGLERALDLVPGPLWQWLKRNVPVWGTPIDWQRTRAYLYNGLPQTVNLNLAGREPEGIVPAEAYEGTRDELAAALREATDPLDGSPIASEVTARDEAFPGRLLDAAPDLLVEVTDDRYLVSPADHPEVVWQTGRERGRHRRTGIYVLRGPAFRPHSEGPREGLVDMMPTLLAAMGCAVPTGIDGRPIGDLLAQGVEVSEKDYALTVPEATAGEEDMALVQRNLEKLGYM